MNGAFLRLLKYLMICCCNIFSFSIYTALTFVIHEFLLSKAFNKLLLVLFQLPNGSGIEGYKKLTMESLPRGVRLIF